MLQENSEELLESLYEIEKHLCKVIKHLEAGSEDFNERRGRRNYRMSRRDDRYNERYSDRYDY